MLEVLRPGINEHSKISYREIFSIILNDLLILKIKSVDAPSQEWVAQVVGLWWHHPHHRRHRHTKTLFAAAFQQRSTGNRNLLLLNRNFLLLLSHNLSNSAFTFYFHSLGNVHRCLIKMVRMHLMEACFHFLQSEHIYVIDETCFHFLLSLYKDVL